MDISIAVNLLPSGLILRICRCNQFSKFKMYKREGEFPGLIVLSSFLGRNAEV